MKMLTETKLTFTTPTFLSGADQNSPEIRVPSIRGALRWWFRVLGGTAEQETSIFGGVHGGAVASSVVVRVGDVHILPGARIDVPPNTNKSYLYHFARVSGNKEGVTRTEAGHYVAPGSTCTLSIGLRREMAPDAATLLHHAIDAFLKLGALGLRATRGCGVFTAGNPCTREEFLAWAAGLRESVFVGLVNAEMYAVAEKCQLALGAFLQDLRRDNHLSSKKQSALGFSDGRARESSALKLRPVQVREGFLPVVVYTDAACSQPSLLEDVRRACSR